MFLAALVSSQEEENQEEADQLLEQWGEISRRTQDPRQVEAVIEGIIERVDATQTLTLQNKLAILKVVKRTVLSSRKGGTTPSTSKQALRIGVFEANLLNHLGRVDEAENVIQECIFAADTAGPDMGAIELTLGLCRAASITAENALRIEDSLAQAREGERLTTKVEHALKNDPSKPEKTWSRSRYVATSQALRAELLTLAPLSDEAVAFPARVRKLLQRAEAYGDVVRANCLLTHALLKAGQFNEAHSLAVEELVPACQEANNPFALFWVLRATNDHGLYSGQSFGTDLHAGISVRENHPWELIVRETALFAEDSNRTSNALELERETQRRLGSSSSPIHQWLEMVARKHVMFLRGEPIGYTDQERRRFGHLIQTAEDTRGIPTNTPPANVPLLALRLSSLY